jgi:hypothetical protein
MNKEIDTKKRKEIGHNKPFTVFVDKYNDTSKDDKKFKSIAFGTYIFEDGTEENIGLLSYADEPLYAIGAVQNGFRSFKRFGKKAMGDNGEFTTEAKSSISRESNKTKELYPVEYLNIK